MRGDVRTRREVHAANCHRPQLLDLLWARLTRSVNGLTPRYTAQTARHHAITTRSTP